MATFPQEFIDLAAELIADEFAAFAPVAVISKATGFDYATQTTTVVTQELPMIALEFKEGQLNGDLIKIGDYMLVGQYTLLEWLPSPENTTITHDAIESRVVRVTVDPAKATVIIHTRRL